LSRKLLTMPKNEYETEVIEEKGGKEKGQGEKVGRLEETKKVQKRRIEK